jgi:hypothetical protein
MRTADFSQAPAPAQAGAMFVGATRYRPLGLVRLLPRWLRMVRDLKRMRGYCWHRVYWQFPFTLGTIAFFTDRDSMLRFARSRHHRAMMVWVTDHRGRNATGGYIRLYTAEPGGYSNGVWRAEDGVLAHIPTFTPLSDEQSGPAVARPAARHG